MVTPGQTWSLEEADRLRGLKLDSAKNSPQKLERLIEHFKKGGSVFQVTEKGTDLDGLPVSKALARKVRDLTMEGKLDWLLERDKQPPTTRVPVIEKELPLVWTVEWLERLGFPKDVAPRLLATYDTSDSPRRKVLEFLVNEKRDNPGMDWREALIRTFIAFVQDQQARQLMEDCIRYKVWEGEVNLNAFLEVIKIKEEEERKRRTIAFLEQLQKAFEKQSASK